MLSIGGGANLGVHLSEKPHPGLKIETRELRPIQTELKQEQQPILRFFIRNSRLRVRFLQTDPMGYEDSLNLYQAFNQNPVNFVDPMGEEIYVIDVTASSNRIKINPTPIEIWYELRKQLTSTLAAKTLRHSERYSNIDESQLIRAEFTLRTGAFVNTVGPGAKFAMSASPAGDVSDWTAVATGYDPMEDEHVSFVERGFYVAGALLPVVKGKHLKNIYRGGKKFLGKAWDFFGKIFRKSNKIKLGSDAKKLLPKNILKLAESNITDTGITVLGRYHPITNGTGQYIAKAKKLNASYFDIGNVWNTLGSEQRKAANFHFLDVIAKRGDKVLLSVPKTKIPKGTELWNEVEYLTKHKGYKWVNQWSLSK
jgi:hypothetical protein